MVFSVPYPCSSVFLYSQQQSVSFSAVIPEHADQSHVYSNVSGLVNGVFDGINGSIIAYGQTGSGKTYTLVGDTPLSSFNHSYPNGTTSLPSDAGITVRAAQQLLSLASSLSSSSSTSSSIQVRLSMTILECYMDDINDLLTGIGNISTDPQALAKCMALVQENEEDDNDDDNSSITSGSVVSSASSSHFSSSQYPSHHPYGQSVSRTLPRTTSTHSVHSTLSRKGSTFSMNGIHHGNGNNSNSNNNTNTNLVIREEFVPDPTNPLLTKQRFIVPHLTTIDITTLQQVIAALGYANTKRRTSSTLMNDASSRSHMLISFYVYIHDKESSITKTGKLTIADLAGSEHSKRTGAEGKQELEGRSINVALSSLVRVITALKEQHKHIPYRDHALTKLLKDGLGGNARTCFLLTLSTESINYETTKSTIAFGESASLVTTRPTVNIIKTYDALVKENNYYETELRIEKSRVALLCDILQQSGINPSTVLAQVMNSTSTMHSVVPVAVEISGTTLMVGGTNNNTSTVTVPSTPTPSKKTDITNISSTLLSPIPVHVRNSINTIPKTPSIKSLPVNKASSSSSNGLTSPVPSTNKENKPTLTSPTPSYMSSTRASSSRASTSKHPYPGRNNGTSIKILGIASPNAVPKRSSRSTTTSVNLSTDVTVIDDTINNANFDDNASTTQVPESDNLTLVSPDTVVSPSKGSAGTSPLLPLTVTSSTSPLHSLYSTTVATSPLPQPFQTSISTSPMICTSNISTSPLPLPSKMSISTSPFLYTANVSTSPLPLPIPVHHHTSTSPFFRISHSSTSPLPAPISITTATSPLSRNHTGTSPLPGPVTYSYGTSPIIQTRTNSTSPLPAPVMVHNYASPLYKYPTFRDQHTSPLPLPIRTDTGIDNTHDFTVYITESMYNGFTPEQVRSLQSNFLKLESEIITLRTALHQSNDECKYLQLQVNNFHRLRETEAQLRYRSPASAASNRSVNHVPYTIVKHSSSTSNNTSTKENSRTNRGVFETLDSPDTSMVYDSPSSEPIDTVTNGSTMDPWETECMNSESASLYNTASSPLPQTLQRNGTSVFEIAANLSSQLEEAHTLNAITTQQSSQLQTQLHQAYELVTNLSNEKIKFEEREQNLLKDTNFIQQALKQANDRIISLEAELCTLREHNAKAETKMQSLTMELDQQTENQRLMNETSVQRVNELCLALEKAEASVVSFRRKYAEAESIRKELGIFRSVAMNTMVQQCRELRTLRIDVETAKQKVTNYENEKNAAEELLQSLQRQVRDLTFHNTVLEEWNHRLQENDDVEDSKVQESIVDTEDKVMNERIENMDREIEQIIQGIGEEINYGRTYATSTERNDILGYDNRSVDPYLMYDTLTPSLETIFDRDTQTMMEANEFMKKRELCTTISNLVTDIYKQRIEELQYRIHTFEKDATCTETVLKELRADAIHLRQDYLYRLQALETKHTKETEIITNALADLHGQYEASLRTVAAQTTELDTYRTKIYDMESHSHQLQTTNQQLHETVQNYTMENQSLLSKIDRDTNHHETIVAELQAELDTTRFQLQETTDRSRDRSYRQQYKVCAYHGAYVGYQKSTQREIQRYIVNTSIQDNTIFALTRAYRDLENTLASSIQTSKDTERSLKLAYEQKYQTLVTDQHKDKMEYDRHISQKNYELAKRACEHAVTVYKYRREFTNLRNAFTSQLSAAEQANENSIYRLKYSFIASLAANCASTKLLHSINARYENLLTTYELQSAEYRQQQNRWIADRTELDDQTNVFNERHDTVHALLTDQVSDNTRKDEKLTVLENTNTNLHSMINLLQNILSVRDTEIESVQQQYQVLQQQYALLSQSKDSIVSNHTNMLRELNLQIQDSKDRYTLLHDQYQEFENLYAKDKAEWKVSNDQVVEQYNVIHSRLRNQEEQLQSFVHQAQKFQLLYDSLYRQYIHQGMKYNAEKVCIIVRDREKYRSLFRACLDQVVLRQVAVTNAMLPPSDHVIVSKDDISLTHGNDSIVIYSPPPATPLVKNGSIKGADNDIEAYRIACASLSSQLQFAHHEIALLRQQVDDNASTNTLTNATPSSSSSVLSRTTYEQDIGKLNQRYITAVSALYDERIRNQMNQFHVERIHSLQSKPIQQQQLSNQLIEAQRINHLLVQEISRQTNEIQSLNEKITELQHTVPIPTVPPFTALTDARDTNLRTASKGTVSLRRLDFITSSPVTVNITDPSSSSSPSSSVNLPFHGTVTKSSSINMNSSSPFLHRLSPTAGLSPSGRSVSLFAVAAGLAVPSVTPSPINSSSTKGNSSSSRSDHVQSGGSSGIKSPFFFSNTSTVTNTASPSTIPNRGTAFDKENIPVMMQQPLLLTEKKPVGNNSNSNHKTLRKEKMDPKNFGSIKSPLSSRNDINSNHHQGYTVLKDTNTNQANAVTKHTKLSLHGPEQTRLLPLRSSTSAPPGSKSSSSFFPSSLSSLFTSSNPSSSHLYKGITNNLGYVPPYGTISTTLTGGISISLLPPPPSTI